MTLLIAQRCEGLRLGAPLLAQRPLAIAPADATALLNIRPVQADAAYLRRVGAVGGKTAEQIHNVLEADY
jgi:hypothetical protein